MLKIYFDHLSVWLNGYRSHIAWRHCTITRMAGVQILRPVGNQTVHTFGLASLQQLVNSGWPPLKAAKSRWLACGSCSSMALSAACCMTSSYLYLYLHLYLYGNRFSLFRWRGIKRVYRLVLIWLSMSLPLEHSDYQAVIARSMLYSSH